MSVPAAHVCPLCGTVCDEKVAGPRSQYPGGTYVRCAHFTHHPVVHFNWISIPPRALAEAAAKKNPAAPASTPASDPFPFAFTQPQSTFIPSSSSSAMQPRKKSSYQPRGGTQLCTFDAPCTNNRIADTCSNNMCKKHCGKTGGCKSRAHNPDGLPKTSSQPAVSQPVDGAFSPVLQASSQPLPSFPAQSQPAPPSSQPRFLVPPMDEDLARFQDGASWQSFTDDDNDDASFPNGPWSAVQQQIADDHAYAIQVAGESGASTPPSSPFAGPSTPQPIPTIDLTADTPPHPTAGAATPRQRIPAPSKKKPPRPIKHLLTKQLNDSWTSQHGVSPAYAKPPLDTTSLLHMRKTTGRRPFDDTATTHRFMLLFLTGDAEPPTISINFSSLVDCVWPRHVPARDPRTLALIGDGGGETIQFYLDKLGIWIDMAVDETHEVHTDGVLVLRWRSARGPNDEVLMKKLLKTEEPQIRHNLVQERRATASALRDEDSDPDVQPNPSKRGSSHDATRDAMHGHRKRPRVTIDTTVASSSSSSLSGLPTPSSSSSPSLSSTTSSASPSPLLLSTPLPSPMLLPSGSRRSRQARGTQWPYGLHVVDVAAGVLRIATIDAKPRAGVPTSIQCAIPAFAYYRVAAVCCATRRWM
ncbi:hypothetical protein HMN09_00932100 [Mycena chlorophos]|uniref:Uncharacterized protein n=1 Tax=Mycena chlorophos TaxID=658473 RepID=A0A8H6VZZ9_MYCCL|nr:hypothetical protein HMN09_00932100 [Mycena chlorophos]